MFCSAPWKLWWVVGGHRSGSLVLKVIGGWQWGTMSLNSTGNKEFEEVLTAGDLNRASA